MIHQKPEKGRCRPPVAVYVVLVILKLHSCRYTNSGHLLIISNIHSTSLPLVHVVLPHPRNWKALTCGFSNRSTRAPAIAPITVSAFDHAANQLRGLSHRGVDPTLVLTGSVVLRRRLDDAVQEDVSKHGRHDEESDDVEGCCIEHGAFVVAVDWTGSAMSGDRQRSQGSTDMFWLG